MEPTVQVPFHQLLMLVKTLTPAQKNKLRKELDAKMPLTANEGEDEFINFLLNGPVYTKEEIAVIEENRKSIAAWRTEN